MSQIDSLVGRYHPDPEINAEVAADAHGAERANLEVGVAWMACIYDLGKCALGSTPREAVENLHRTFGESGRSRIYGSALKECGS